MSSRYMIKIQVVEINERGTQIDLPDEYATELAITDAQEADYIANVLIADADKLFNDRDDASPVEPVGACHG